MVAPPLLLVACAVVALLPLRPRAAPAQPAYPGDDAPVEELLRFYNDLQQYLNVVTRPRYGKRAGGRGLAPGEGLGGGRSPPKLPMASGSPWGQTGGKGGSAWGNSGWES
uniref:PAHO protein n=1 Tax=Junco hyemalis TaxID=40217 RepID=A0A8C5IW08_JUNHY